MFDIKAAPEGLKGLKEVMLPGKYDIMVTDETDIAAPGGENVKSFFCVAPKLLTVWKRHCLLDSGEITVWATILRPIATWRRIMSLR